MQAEEMIKNGLVFNPEYLEHQTIRKLEQEEFAGVYDRVIPSFCYDNSFLTAVALDAEAIVYGAALTRFSSTLLPIEHAWVRFADGRCVDPTYQKLEQERGDLLEVSYYKLFEIPMLEYLDIAEELGNKVSPIVAMDFSWFRRSPKFKQYFDTGRLQRSA